MALTSDVVINDLLQILSSIPFVLISVKSIQYSGEYVLKLNCGWLYEVRLFNPNNFLVREYTLSNKEEVKNQIISILEELALRIDENIINYNTEYQILDDYYFDNAGNVVYSFNSVRFAENEIAIEFDLFTTELDDLQCIRDYEFFGDEIKRNTAAKSVVFQRPRLLDVIRKRKLERIQNL
jgi:hypothetical protein